MATDTRRLRVIVTGDSGDAQQAVEAVGNSAEKSGGKLGKLAGMLGTFATRGAIALGVLASAGAVMGIKTAMQLEQVEMGFTNMLGSATKAKKFMKELADFAAKTPFEFTELVGSAQRFLAMGFAAKDIIPMLTAVGDAVAAMGGSAESVDAVTRALGQMSAKGKVSGEELMQLTEQGIPALKILADSFGVSTQELSKMIEKGQVASDKAIPALIAGLEHGTKSMKGFGGMMDKQSTTLAGKWSTFMDNLTTGLGTFVRNFEPQLKKGLDVAGELVGDFFAGLQGKGPVQGFKGTMNEIGLGLVAMVEAFKEGDVTSDGIVGKFEKIGVAARQVSSAIALIIGVTKDVVGWMDQHETATKRLTVAIIALVAITQIHAAVTAIEIKNLKVVKLATDAATAAHWLYNAAISAGDWARFLGFATKYQFITKVMPALTKAWAAAQWAWNAAMTANPIGAIIVAIIAVIAVIVLLWKHNDNFRKNTIQAWNQLKMVIGAVADFFTKTVFPAIGAAVGWLREQWTKSWNQLKDISNAVAGWFMSYVWPTIRIVLQGIGWWLNFLYNAVWKPIWILIQIAAKIVVFWFRDVMLPIYKAVFNAIVVAIKFLYTGWQFYWGYIKAAAAAVANWFTGIILPSLRKAFDQLKAVVAVFVAGWQYHWNNAKAIGNAVASWFNNSIVASLRKAFDQLKAFLGLLKAGWDDNWTKIKKATDVATKAMGAAFKWAKDYIGTEWAKLKGLAKAPVDFVVNTVYNNGIRKFWNTVADKFGIKTRLDPIKFAEGGVVPGFGPRKDRINAMLSPGEGIAVPELIKQIGVNRFLDWNKKAREGKPVAFADGGIVGWGKSLLNKGKEVIQGFASPIVKPLLDALRGIINRGLPGGGLKELLRAGGNKAVDGIASWVSGKDKAALDFGAHLGGTAGGRKLNGMGWQMQMFLLRNRFPGLPLISGYRPGAVTLTGNRSYHSMGRAVDVPPRKDVFNWIKGTFGPAIKELIFSPMGKGQVWNGRNHYYGEPIRGQHWSHVHWAMDNGGTLPPNSTTVVRNATNSNEYALPEGKLKRMFGGSGVNIENLTIEIHDARDPEKVARAVRDELKKLGRRNGGLAGTTV